MATQLIIRPTIARQFCASWMIAALVAQMPFNLARAEPVRVALVGSNSTGAVPAGGVIALAEAKLSATEGLEVLERQQIDRVLKEQKLSLAGLVDAVTAIKAGQVLSVDLFALVEQSPDGKESLACIVYDTKTGLRLADVTLSGDGIEAVAGEVVSAVEGAVKKQSAGIAGVKLLSVVGVRNADLPRSLDTTCESVGLLLERELARSGDIALLERKRLGWLQQERTLSATEADRKLLASTLQADLQFARHENGVRATVIVTDATGQQLHKATAESKQLDATLVTPLVESLLKGLNAKRTASPTNALRESQRFFREAEQRWSFKEPALAIQAAEAALLLDPDNADRMLLLAEYLFHNGSRTFWKLTTIRAEGQLTYRPLSVEECSPVGALGMRAIELSDAGYRRINPRSMNELYAFSTRTLALDTVYLEFFNSLPVRDRITSEGQAAWGDTCRELADASWRFSREQLTRWNDATRMTPGASFAYSLAVPRALRRLEQESKCSDHASSRALELLDEWLTRFESLPAPYQPFVHVGAVLNPIVRRTDSPPFDPAVLDPLVARLEKHSVPLLQLYGRHARLLQKNRGLSPTVAERIAGMNPLRVDLFALLDAPENKTDTVMRVACYSLLSHLVSSLSPIAGTAEYEEEVSSICDAMMARRELQSGLFLAGVFDPGKLTPDIARRRMARIDAALALSQQQQHTLVENTDPRVTRQTLERARADFLARYRDLFANTSSLRVQTRVLMEFPPQRGPGIQLSALHATKMYVPVVSGENVVCLVMASRFDQVKRHPVVSLKAVSIPLDSGKPTSLGEIDTSLQIRSSAETAHLATAATIHDGRYYAATSEGLAEYDLKSTKARIINLTEKFPATKVQSMASFDGRLWMGLEGGYLISFAPETEDVRVVVSSRRKEKLSPLDDSEAFSMGGIVPDPDRERLLFLVRTRQENKSEMGGLWEYRPKPNSFQQVLDFKLFPESITPLRDNRVVITSGPWAVSYDVVADKSFVVANYPLGPKLEPNRKQFFQMFLRRPVICTGRLWSAHIGQAQEGKLTTVRLNTNDDQLLPVDIPPLDKDEIFAGWYVAPVDNKRFLWSNHHRLWLVTPEGGEALKTLAKP